MILTGLDTETTGLDTQNDRIIEIALVPYQLESRKWLGKYVSRVNPLMPIHAKATEVHGLTLSDLATAPKWEDGVAQRVHTIISKSQIIVAHNGASFDIPLLAAEFARAGLEFPNVGVLDTMQAARWATEDGKYPKLKELCWALDIPYDEKQAHGAEYDVLRMMECLIKGHDMGYFEELNIGRTAA